MQGRYHYHQIFRKTIISFATIFNNILIKRLVNPGTADTSTLESLKVPIQFGSYEKVLARIAASPEDKRQSFEYSLPRMSFDIRGLSYDGSRKVVPTQFMKSLPNTESKQGTQSGTQYRQFMPVPYNLEMGLSILAKNSDDGLQILEQILPNFHPSVNVSIEVIDETHEERDIAIVLNNIQYQDDYEGDISQRGTIIWTLNFTVKTYLFGPIDIQKDIRKVKVNYRSDIIKRPTELRYSAEVVSTKTPPVSSTEVNPRENEYNVKDKYEDIFSEDNNYFGVE